MAFRTTIINRFSPRISCRAGFALAESLIASIVLAVAVVGISQLLSVSAQHNEAAQQQLAAVAFAQQLLQEIAAKPFDDPDQDEAAGAPRTSFDDIHDYHLYADASDSVNTLAGDSLPLGDQVLQRSVTVEHGVKPPLAAGTPDEDLALVTVRVSMPNGHRTEISRLMARNKLTLP